MRSLLVAALASIGALAIAWIAGTLWIHSRESATSADLPDAFPGRVIDVEGPRVRILELRAGPPVLLVAGVRS